MTDVTLKIICVELTDGSAVVDVNLAHVGEADNTIVLATFGRDDAIAFAEGLAKLFDKYTCDGLNIQDYTGGRNARE